MAFPVLLCLILQLSYSNYVESKAPSAFFRKDYTYLADLQSFYKVHTTQRNWWSAKKRCEMEGAKLWVPEDAAETDAIIAFWRQLQPGFAWVYIGASDQIAEGEFQTIDGRPIEEVYNKWDVGEPNDSDQLEDCVILNKDGNLNDDRCQKIIPFICKKTLENLEWNPFCDLPDLNYLYDSKLGKCYKFHYRPLNWTDAYSLCSAEQSYLAVIDSQAEADHLVKMTADADKDKVKGKYLRGAVHLGFHNQERDGFKTIKGVRLDESGYSKWGNGQPDNAGGSELCGSMFYNGGLNDMTCGVVCFFICEHDVGYLGSSIDERYGEGT